MSLGFWQLIIIIAVVLILFGGKGKIISFFAEFAKGIKILRKELTDDEKNKDIKDLEK